MSYQLEGKLDPWFCALSISQGNERTRRSREAGLTTEAHSGDGSGFFDPSSRIAENTVAMVFGLPFGPIDGTFKTTPDVGPLEVQSILVHPETKGKNLLVRESDGEALARPYVLVHLFSETPDPRTIHSYWIPGWMTGEEGRQVGTDSWWPGYPCKVVDYRRLRQFDDVFTQWLNSWKESQA